MGLCKSRASVKGIDNTVTKIDDVSDKLLKESKNARDQMNSAKEGLDKAKVVLKIPHDTHKEVKDFGTSIRKVKTAANGLTKVPIAMMKPILVPIGNLCTMALSAVKSTLKAIKKADDAARPVLKKIDEIKALLSKVEASLVKLEKTIPVVQECSSEFAAIVCPKLQKKLQDGNPPKKKCFRLCGTDKDVLLTANCVNAVKSALDTVNKGCEDLCNLKAHVEKVQKEVDAKVGTAKKVMKDMTDTTSPIVEPLNSAVKSIEGNKAVQAGLKVLSTLDGLLKPIFDSILKPIVAPLESIVKQCNPVQKELDALEETIRKSLMKDLMEHLDKLKDELDGIVKFEESFDKETTKYKDDMDTVGIDELIKRRLQPLKDNVKKMLKEQLAAAAQQQQNKLQENLWNRSNAEALFEAFGLGDEAKRILGDKPVKITVEEPGASPAPPETDGAKGKGGEEEEELGKSVVSELEKKLLEKNEQTYNDAVDKCIDDVTNPSKITAALKEGKSLAKTTQRLTKKDVKKAEVVKAKTKAKKDVEQEAKAVEKDIQEEAIRLVKAELQRQKKLMIKAAEMEVKRQAMKLLTSALNKILGETVQKKGGTNWGLLSQKDVGAAIKVLEPFVKPQAGEDSGCKAASKEITKEDKDLDALIDGNLPAWP